MCCLAMMASAWKSSSAWLRATYRSGERIDPHFAEPAQSLKLARALGLLPEYVTVVGCEPASCQLGMPLSVAAKAAVDSAVETIHGMVVADRHRATGETDPV
jgi:hydrogenase maturation protease